MLDAAVVIVNYRTADRVCALITALAAAGVDAPSEIVVIDNSPAEGLGAHPDLRRAAVRYAAAPANEGFAAGVNRGVRMTDRPAVILLNPDAMPDAGCLSGLVAQLSATDEAAVAGPALLPFNAGAAPQPSALTRDPQPADLLLEYSPLGRVFRRRAHIAPPATGVPGGPPRECAMVQGACFALRRDWMRRVGEFDARRFFLYWEETDYCRRVRTAGGRVFYCPGLRCRHTGGASTDDGRQNVEAFWRSLYAYVEKHHGRAVALALRGALAAGVGAEWMMARAAAAVRKHGPDHARYVETLARRWRAQFVDRPHA